MYKLDMRTDIMHTRTHRRTHAHTHARTHARMHTRTHAQLLCMPYIIVLNIHRGTQGLSISI